MNITYQPLFVLQMQHDYYEDNRCRDFDIIPTLACQNNLRRFGLGIKVYNDQAIIYCEKQNGSTSPRIPIQGDIRLTFGLRLKTPFFSKITELPSGTQPFLLSNLNTDGSFKTANADGNILLSKNITIDSADQMAIRGDGFSIDLPNGNTSQVRAAVLRPLTSFQNLPPFDIKLGSRNANIKFSENQRGLIRLDYPDTGSPNTAYVDTELAAMRSFAFIEIWKNAQTDYTKTEKLVVQWRRRADIWRYFIINTVSNQALSVGVNKPNNPSPVYPSISFNAIEESNQTEFEKSYIHNLEKPNIVLFRSSVPIPQFEKPFGKISLKSQIGQDTQEVTLAPPAFSTLDNNIIFKF
jgi:hypothetical protein